MSSFVVDRWLYPFEQKFFHFETGLRMSYLDEGEGETLVMVHGNPTWSFYYREMVKAFRKTHRVIVPDHIGCGLSDKPSDRRYIYTLKSRVDDLEALLEHANAGDKLTLVLHDWGGMIGMAYAHRYPERIKRLVLLNTAAFHLPGATPFPWALKFTRTPLGAFLTRGKNAFCKVAARACVTRKKMSPQVRRMYLAPYNSWANRIGVLRFVQDIPLQEGDPAYGIVSKVEENLSQFAETPTIIFWGGRDFVFTNAFLEAWKEKMPHAEAHSLPECGHYVLEDAPEEIIEGTRAFLEKHPIS